MAKKRKAVVDLTAEQLTFELDDLTAKILSFDPNAMTLRLNFYNGDRMVKSDAAFPFAHLPKALKQRVKPN